MKAKQILWRLLRGILIATVIIGGYFAYQLYYDRKVPNFTDEMDLYVYPGMDVRELRDSILSAGIVRSEGSLKRVFRDVMAIHTIGAIYRITRIENKT